MMNTIVADKIPQLTELCRKYSVARMYIFGSAARGDDFDSATSDIDFLIAFRHTLTLEEYADNYFDLMFDLDDLFGREVDLMTERQLKNPYLIASIDKDKKLIYETAA